MRKPQQDDPPAIRRSSPLLWRCRRGIREMDLLLQSFIRQYLDTLSPEQQIRLGQLLDEADLDIMSWIMGTTRPNHDRYDELLALLCKTRQGIRPHTSDG